MRWQWRIQDFPEEGAPTPQRGAPTYDFAKFSQKLHEIERIWTPGGGGPASLVPPLDPPLDGMHAISTHQVIRLFAGGIYTFLSDDGDRAGVFANEVRHA